MKILIFHTAFIGDIVLSTPLITKIKAKYPYSQISYITTPVCANVLQNNPHLEEILIYDKKGTDRGFKGILKLIRKLRTKKFDIAYIPHRYFRSQAIVYFSGIKERVGYDIAAGSFFLTQKIFYDQKKHEVERLLSFIDLDNFKDTRIQIHPGQPEKTKIEKIWKENNLEKKKSLSLLQAVNGLLKGGQTLISTT